METASERGGGGRSRSRCATRARTATSPSSRRPPSHRRARTAGAEVNSIEHLRNIELDCAKDNESLHEERQAILQNQDQLPGFILRSNIHKLQRLTAIRNYSRDECMTTLKALSNTLQVPTLRLNSISLDLPFDRADWDQAFSFMPTKTQKDWSYQIQAQRQQNESTQTNTESAIKSTVSSQPSQVNHLKSTIRTSSIRHQYGAPGA